MRDEYCRARTTSSTGFLGQVSHALRVDLFHVPEVGRVVRAEELVGGSGQLPPAEKHHSCEPMKSFRVWTGCCLSQMIAIFRVYPRPVELLPQAVAKLPSAPELSKPVAKPELGDSLVWLVPWGHLSVLIE